MLKKIIITDWRLCGSDHQSFSVVRMSASCGPYLGRGEGWPVCVLGTTIPRTRWSWSRMRLQIWVIQSWKMIFVTFMKPRFLNFKGYYVDLSANINSRRSVESSENFSGNLTNNCGENYFPWLQCDLLFRSGINLAFWTLITLAVYGMRPIFLSFLAWKLPLEWLREPFSKLSGLFITKSKKLSTLMTGKIFP